MAKASRKKAAGPRLVLRVVDRGESGRRDVYLVEADGGARAGRLHGLGVAAADAERLAGWFAGVGVAVERDEFTPNGGRST